MSKSTFPALVKFRTTQNPTPRWGFVHGDLNSPDSAVSDLDDSINLDTILTTAKPLSLLASLAAETAGLEISQKISDIELLAPIESQEVWGAGVTYYRSKVARQEESKSGGSFYDLVYSADRPELFFKATPHRTVGPNQAIRVRSDSNWCVPEPELALVFSTRMELIGVTIGDDVSARDIEGENPLYLPQAKMHIACCALGPGIVPVEALPAREKTVIRVHIVRNGQTVVDGSTTLDQMKRGFDELAGWLGRDNSFPHGVILLTGTGVVPPDDFSMQPGDMVHLSITGIGTLTNCVEKG
ncbi:MAG: fumarylacetoacetate hydrolase family protein [Planctomycetota bacterium]